VIFAKDEAECYNKAAERFAGTWQTEKYIVWKIDEKTTPIMTFHYRSTEPKTNSEISQSYLFPLSFVNLMNEYCS
jgi:hypothetical protein